MFIWKGFCVIFCVKFVSAQAICSLHVQFRLLDYPPKDSVNEDSVNVIIFFTRELIVLTFQ